MKHNQIETALSNIVREFYKHKESNFSVANYGLRVKVVNQFKIKK